MPERSTAAGSNPAGEHHVSRKVLRFAAETVVEPGAHGGKAKRSPPALHHELPGMVIELLRVERSHHEEVVRAGPEVRQKVGKLHSTLTVLLVGPARSQELGVLVDEREPHVLSHGLRQDLPMQFVQLRLGIEEIDLGWRARHKEENAVLGFAREMRALGSERVWRGRGSEESVLLEKAGQRNPPHPAGGGVEKRAPGEFQLGLNVDIVSMMHNYSRVINSSRLRAVRATATQAAASGVATPSGRYFPISFFPLSGCAR